MLLYEKTTIRILLSERLADQWERYISGKRFVILWNSARDIGPSTSKRINVWRIRVMCYHFRNKLRLMKCDYTSSCSALLESNGDLAKFNIAWEIFLRPPQMYSLRRHSLMLAQIFRLQNFLMFILIKLYHALNNNIYLTPRKNISSSKIRDFIQLCETIIHIIFI